MNYVDVSELTDYEAAKVINDLNIDILINLKGHTHKNRLGMFAYQPAPI